MEGVKTRRLIRMGVLLSCFDCLGLKRVKTQRKATVVCKLRAGCVPRPRLLQVGVRHLLIPAGVCRVSQRCRTLKLQYRLLYRHHLRMAEVHSSQLMLWYDKHLLDISVLRLWLSLLAWVVGILCNLLPKMHH